MVEEGRSLAIVVFAHLHEQDEVHYPTIPSERNDYRLTDTHRVLGNSLDLSNLDTMTIPFQLTVHATTQANVALTIDNAVVPRAVEPFDVTNAKKGVLWMGLPQISMSDLWPDKLQYS